MGRIKTISDGELIEVARRVFREGGHSATTRDVAAAAGISQAVLYQRFQTKDELFFAAMLPQPPDLETLLGECPGESQDTLEYLVGVATRMLAYLGESAPAILHLVTHPSFTPAMMAQAHERILAEQLVEALTERLGVLQKDKRLSSVDIHGVAHTFIAALHSMAIFHVLAANEPGETESGQVRGFVTVLWQGLRNS